MTSLRGRTASSRGSRLPGPRTASRSGRPGAPEIGVETDISTDPAQLDVELVHRWLSTDAYWSLGRSREVVERSIAHSLNFGAYDGATLVGYARVVTDRATFAWLCDVYVARDRRGAGVGTALLDAVAAELGPLGLKRTMLATADAHEVYARYGFEPLPDPERFMVLGGDT